MCNWQLYLLCELLYHAETRLQSLKQGTIVAEAETGNDGGKTSDFRRRLGNVVRCQTSQNPLDRIIAFHVATRIRKRLIYFTLFAVVATSPHSYVVLLFGFYGFVIEVLKPFGLKIRDAKFICNKQ